MLQFIFQNTVKKHLLPSTYQLLWNVLHVFFFCSFCSVYICIYILSETSYSRDFSVYPLLCESIAFTPVWYLALGTYSSWCIKMSINIYSIDSRINKSGWTEYPEVIHNIWRSYFSLYRLSCIYSQLQEFYVSIYLDYISSLWENLINWLTLCIAHTAHCCLYLTRLWHFKDVSITG